MKRTLAAALLTVLATSGALAFEVKKDDKQPFPTFKVTGWIKATYANTVYHEPGKVTACGVEIKDAAVVVGGDAWAATSYRIYLQGNKRNKVDSADIFHKSYGAYTPRLVEAYIDWKPSPLYSFRAGQYKKPMGLDNLVAATSFDFINNAQLTANFLSNNYDAGLMGYGKWRDLGYWLSLHNGAAYNYKDKNWAKDVIARATYLALPGLTVGGNAEYGTGDGAGMSLYRRRAGLDASFEWKKLYARAEWMIGLDDKSVSDSLSRTASKNVTDTIRTGYMDTLGAWHDTTYTRVRSVSYKSWTRKTLVDQALARGAYLTLGYVVMPKLRVAARADYHRADYSWKLAASGADTSWAVSEARNLNWTIGADYFLNPNAKVTLNYDIRQEDMALPLVKNNVLSLQAQVKF